MRKLYRSSTDKRWAGVCGGLGEYFNIDPIIFRIIFLVVFFLRGSGIIIYIILSLLLPYDYQVKNTTYQRPMTFRNTSTQRKDVTPKEDDWSDF